MKKLNENDLPELLVPIAEDSNKGTNGLLTVVAGSVSYRGAADLCVSGALRSGAGIVRLISVGKAVDTVSVRHPSATFAVVDEDAEGFISEAAADTIKKYAEKSTALLIGCGLGRGKGAPEAVNAVLESGKPAVLDADALNALAEKPLLSGKAKSPLIVTPHIGEMSRLCGKTPEEIKKDREKVAKDFSLAHNCVTVLKDCVTVISDESGNTFECLRGSEGLAKGGSGDVLAGIIAGLLASGHEAAAAAKAGTLIHSLASLRCAEKYGKKSMLPSELEYFVAALMAEKGF